MSSPYSQLTILTSQVPERIRNNLLRQTPELRKLTWVSCQPHTQLPRSFTNLLQLRVSKLKSVPDLRVRCKRKHLGTHAHEEDTVLNVPLDERMKVREVLHRECAHVGRTHLG